MLFSVDSSAPLGLILQDSADSSTPLGFLECPLSVACFTDNLHGSDHTRKRCQSRFNPLCQRNDNKYSTPLLPISANFLEHLLRFCQMKPVDDNVGIPHDLLQIRHNFQKEEQRIDHLQTEPSFRILSAYKTRSPSLASTYLRYAQRLIKHLRTSSLELVTSNKYSALAQSTDLLGLLHILTCILSLKLP